LQINRISPKAISFFNQVIIYAIDGLIKLKQHKRR
jgi:hypothetical protein